MYPQSHNNYHKYYLLHTNYFVLLILLSVLPTTIKIRKFGCLLLSHGIAEPISMFGIIIKSYNMKLKRDHNNI